MFMIKLFKNGTYNQIFQCYFQNTKKINKFAEEK